MYTQDTVTTKVAPSVYQTYLGHDDEPFVYTYEFPTDRDGAYIFPGQSLVPVDEDDPKPIYKVIGFETVWKRGRIPLSRPYTMCISSTGVRLDPLTCRHLISYDEGEFTTEDLAESIEGL